jgi:hypothetical protein
LTQKVPNQPVQRIGPSRFTRRFNERRRWPVPVSDLVVKCQPNRKSLSLMTPHFHLADLAHFQTGAER